MTHVTHTLSVLPGRFAVCRLGPQAVLPLWACQGDVFSITRTPDELSVVCPEQDVPGDVVCEKGWACLQVEGPLDFSMTGVLASLAQPLAEAGIALFVISTYDTDYLLVKAHVLVDSVAVLTQAAHVVHWQNL